MCITNYLSPPDIAPLEAHCHNNKNTTFHDRGLATGRGDAIASKERQFSPLAAVKKIDV
jgi:hypothetical protein